jgi:hypothetical protein
VVGWSVKVPGANFALDMLTLSNGWAEIERTDTWIVMSLPTFSGFSATVSRAAQGFSYAAGCVRRTRQESRSTRRVGHSAGTPLGK